MVTLIELVNFYESKEVEVYFDKARIYIPETQINGQNVKLTLKITDCLLVEISFDSDMYLDLPKSIIRELYLNETISYRSDGLFTAVLGINSSDFEDLFFSIGTVVNGLLNQLPQKNDILVQYWNNPSEYHAKRGKSCSFKRKYKIPKTNTAILVTKKKYAEITGDSPHHWKCDFYTLILVDKISRNYTYSCYNKIENEGELKKFYTKTEQDLNPDEVKKILQEAYATLNSFFIPKDYYLQDSDKGKK